MSKKPDTRVWYEKKRYMLPTILAGLWTLGAVLADPVPTPNTTPAAVQIAPSIPESRTIPPVEQAPDTQDSTVTESSQTPPVTTRPPSVSPRQVELSNDNHYTNVDGETVHSPAYAPDVPEGASAQCRDGTYSFSRNRRGTCSHHGGVATWL